MPTTDTTHACVRQTGPYQGGITDWRYGVNMGGEWVRRVAWPARSPTDTRSGCFDEGRNGSRE